MGIKTVSDMGNFSVAAGCSLVSLRAFCEAARKMSFTAAAKQLDISQSAVSHHIKLLEEKLGVSLFIRNNRRRISLTDEGRHLYESAIRRSVSSIKPSAVLFPVLSKGALFWVFCPRWRPNG